MGHLDPRQDEEAGVIGDEMDTLAAYVLLPADEAVPDPKVPRCRRPGHAGYRCPARADHVLEVLPDRPAITEVMVRLDQALDERLLIGTPHLAKRKRSKLRESGLDRIAGEDRLRDTRPTLEDVVPRRKPDGRQFDQGLPVEEEQKAPAHHVAESA